MTIYKPGDFSFYRDVEFREALEFDFNVIQTIGLWPRLKNHNSESSLMFSNLFNGYSWWGGHSGASFGCSIRIMENIAKNGWESYLNNYNLN
jgi:hypothetical protein